VSISRHSHISCLFLLARVVARLTMRHRLSEFEVSPPEAFARACVGFLLVRGGVHIVAYAKGLEKLSGVDVGKLLPIPDITNKRFPEAAQHEAGVLHRILFQFSPRTTGVRARSGTASTQKTRATRKPMSAVPRVRRHPNLRRSPS
jgi:Mn-containing catalase